MPFVSSGRNGPRVRLALRRCLYAGMAAALSAGMIPGGARAQEAVGRATFEPPPDPATIVTLQTENDVIGRTDRNYTAGIRLGITLPSGEMPEFLREVGHALLGPGRQRISLNLSQTIFTPRDTDLVIPDPSDRPYAGVLAAQLNLLHDTSDARTILSLGLGVIGPMAQGEELQNGFHSLINTTPSNGWDSQIKNMPVAQATVARIWRVPLLGHSGSGLEMDVLPSAFGAFGTWRIYAQLGAQLRIGQGLDTDFGTSRIAPGLTGADAYTPTRPFVWYFFAGADGQAVAFDATLDGNPFQSGPHVHREPFVGEIELGFAVIYEGLRFSYTHVLQTQEFRGQRGGVFQFGSFTVAARF